MESEEQQTCQWKSCDAPASKHAAFGLNVFDAPDGAHISKSPNNLEHFDLCATHLEKVRLQYVHVKEYPLGMCPAHRDH